MNTVKVGTPPSSLDARTRKRNLDECAGFCAEGEKRRKGTSARSPASPGKDSKGVKGGLSVENCPEEEAKAYAIQRAIVEGMNG